MIVDLVDGTYELFRQHYGLPAEVRSTEGTKAAARGVVNAMLWMLENGSTHLGVATDHVIESFRNEMWPTYKSSAGVDRVLLAQFGVLEDALAALGVRVFAMVELEADDALASVAAIAAGDPGAGVEQIRIHTPDKDLAQCVRANRVVQYDRRKPETIDEAAVIAKYGVAPGSIADWLALVGDTADGYPGLPGWGKKSAATVLARYRRLEDIPASAAEWDCAVRGAATLSATLEAHREEAFLFRDLATLRVDRSLAGAIEELRWVAPTDDFPSVCRSLGEEAEPLLERAARLASERSGES